MATVVTERKSDDLDPTQDANQTVDFGLDDIRYEIDLTDANAQKLRDILDPFIAVARRAGRPNRPDRPERPARKKRLHPETARDIRVWAREHGGHDVVADRGRLPEDIIEAYYANDPSIFRASA